jgi:hypothetical protein
MQHRIITRAERRDLERQNAKWPVLPQEISRERWPGTPTTDVRLAVFRSRDFLIQVFEAQAPALVRLSINRTQVDERTQRWSENITWDELQWIKNVLGYHDRDAVEVFPPTMDVVDVANMRHLWVLSEPLAFAWRRTVAGRVAGA